MNGNCCRCSGTHGVGCVRCVCLFDCLFDCVVVASSWVNEKRDTSTILWWFQKEGMTRQEASKTTTTHGFILPSRACFFVEQTTPQNGSSNKGKKDPAGGRRRSATTTHLSRHTHARQVRHTTRIYGTRFCLSVTILEMGFKGWIEVCLTKVTVFLWQFCGCILGVFSCTQGLVQLYRIVSLTLKNKQPITVSSLCLFFWHDFV